MNTAPRQQREPTTHRLKSWPDSFRAAVSGRKRFEIRKDDRQFEPGDLVELHEWDPSTEGGFSDEDARITRVRGYTGRVARFFIGYIERSSALPPGWCGFELVTGEEINRAAVALGRLL